MDFEVEYIQEILDALQAKKKRKRRKKKDDFISSFLAWNCCCYILILSYLLSSTSFFKFVSDDNLYDDAMLIISQDKIDELCRELEKELDINIGDEDVADYLLLNAVRENKYLNDSQKYVFYSFIDMIKDNPYIDKEQAYRSLLNVDVNCKKKPSNVKNNVQGCYDYSLLDISIFVDDPDNMILKHEGIHCIFDNRETTNLPTFFKEGMTELLVNEYFEANPYLEVPTYPFEIAAVKMLCEVVGSDKMLEAYSTGDINIIISELAKLNGSIEGSRKVIDTFEEVLSFLRCNGTYMHENDAVADLLLIMRNSVQSKYMDDSEQSMECLSNYDNYERLFGSVFYSEPYAVYASCIVDFGIVEKPYFSSKLKASYNKSNNNYADFNNRILLK